MANTTIYLIDSTDGGTTFAIQPQTFNGFGSVQSNSDLTLYGNSTPQWGERFNENFYKLLENFAIDQNSTFNLTSTTPPIPHDSISAPLNGTGINNPIIGQTWFNKSDRKMYVYTEFDWKGVGSASTTKPISPFVGDLWYDGATSQLKFYNGTAWIGVSTSGGSFVSKSGDSMSGSLDISNNSTATQLTLHNTIGPVLFIRGDSTTYNASVAPLIAFYNPDNNPSINGSNGSNFPYMKFSNRDGHYFSIEVDTSLTPGSGTAVLYADQITDDLVYALGEMLLSTSQIANITNAKHVATKEYVDSVAGTSGGTFVLRSGDTMTGNLSFDVSSSSRKIIFDSGSPFVAGGNVELGYATNGLVSFTTNAGSGGLKTILTIDPLQSRAVFGENVQFNKNINCAGNTTHTGNVTMSSGGDVVLDHDPVQLLEAATKQYVDVSGGVNIGFVLPFPTTSTPSGFLRCNGAAFSRSVYSNLFSVIGTAYGVGNGSTTFNVPDLRGEFIRGFDDGRGVDLGRAIGSAQSDELRSHTHLFAPTSTNTATGEGAQGGITTGTAGSSQVIVPFNVGSTGGNETRPRNVAMLLCIKF